MRIRRRLPIWLGVLLVAAAIALVVFLRKHAPPEPARLLPGADGFIYINLKWIRRANVTGQMPTVPHDPEYEQFIQATGFQFERDLDQAALAIHYAANLPVTPGVPPQPRFSEIFVGRIDGEKLRAYLRKLATAVESDGSVDIYSIPLEGRTLRLAILSVDTVAASNHPDPQVIRSIVERSRKLASPFGGPALLRQYYKQVPLASLAWAIFKVDPAASHWSSSPMDLSVLFSKPATVVSSARYLGSIHLRAEAFTESAEEARRVAAQLETFLNIFHTAETTLPSQSSDPDVKQFFSSLKVQQSASQVVLSAIMPPGFLRKAVAAPPPGEALPSPAAKAPNN
jgi:hypothetical protein